MCISIFEKSILLSRLNVLHRINTPNKSFVVVIKMKYTTIVSFFNYNKIFLILKRFWKYIYNEKMEKQIVIYNLKLIRINIYKNRLKITLLKKTIDIRLFYFIFTITNYLKLS